MSDKVWWIVMALRRWQDLELSSTASFRLPVAVINDSDGCIGFLPVFETKEQAERYAAVGNRAVVAVRPTEEVPA